MFTYEIEGNTVLVYVSGQEPPMLAQPFYPSGESWTKKQANDWAALYVNSQNNNNSELLAGNSKKEPVLVRAEVLANEEPIIMPELPVFEPVVEESAGEPEPAPE